MENWRLGLGCRLLVVGCRFWGSRGLGRSKDWGWRCLDRTKRNWHQHTEPHTLHMPDTRILTHMYIPVGEKGGPTIPRTKFHFDFATLHWTSPSAVFVSVTVAVTVAVAAFRLMQSTCRTMRKWVRLDFNRLDSTRINSTHVATCGYICIL